MSTSERREHLLRVLADAPLAVNITDIDGRLVFSDIPERLVPQLEHDIGPAFLESMALSDEEKAFIDAIPEAPAAEARWLRLFRDGTLAERVSGLEPQARAPYFMAAINTSDEAVLGRTGVLYFVCKKGCHFCQYRGFREETLDVERAAELMLAFQEAGADNVQWLSPSAYTRFLMQALLRAAEQGFTLPIVHKSEGEDTLRDLALLDGVVDIYLPDAKFVRAETASRIGLSTGYAERMPACIAEMQRQVGPLRRRAGTRVAQSGVLARHLLMPGGVEEGARVLDVLSAIDPEMVVHLMTLYQPFDRAREMPELNRPTTPEEGAALVAHARSTKLRCMVR